MQSVNIFKSLTHIPVVDFIVVAYERGEKRFVANIINHPRYAQAAGCDFLNCPRGKMEWPFAAG